MNYIFIFVSYNSIYEWQSTLYTMLYVNYTVTENKYIHVYSTWPKLYFYLFICLFVCLLIYLCVVCLFVSYCLCHRVPVRINKRWIDTVCCFQRRNKYCLYYNKYLNSHKIHVYLITLEHHNLCFRMTELAASVYIFH